MFKMLTTDPLNRLYTAVFDIFYNLIDKKLLLFKIYDLLINSLNYTKWKIKKLQKINVRW